MPFVYKLRPALRHLASKLGSDGARDWAWADVAWREEAKGGGRWDGTVAGSGWKWYKSDGMGKYVINGQRGGEGEWEIKRRENQTNK